MALQSYTADPQNYLHKKKKYWKPNKNLKLYSTKKIWKTTRTTKLKTQIDQQKGEQKKIKNLVKISSFKKKKKSTKISNEVHKIKNSVYLE